MPPGVLLCSNCNTGAITSDAAATPNICMICCRKGEAPTRAPVLRSLHTSPEVHAAQQTMAATPSVATMPSIPLKPKRSSSPPVKSTAVMVMPETGLLELPTSPTM